MPEAWNAGSKGTDGSGNVGFSRVCVESNKYKREKEQMFVLLKVGQEEGRAGNSVDLELPLERMKPFSAGRD